MKAEVRSLLGQKAQKLTIKAFCLLLTVALFTPYCTSWEKRATLQATQSLVLKLLNRRVGQLPETITQQVENLPVQELEALREALLDFTSFADLELWLELIVNFVTPNCLSKDSVR